ncbi:copper transport protein ctr4 [Plectosphaerella cucumerina]|uniref:Copper transport protein n=1 Tax=Plectosphaerella cucumerina TaxID=40658 RepID=A0A8K0TCV2_9PEZI|nr:copper transport protein ctr4 [Plectosphaerella cucumerina]
MSHSAHGGDAVECKVSMLWNWYTIDACFLAESWHITNNGAFAASCIGVALLTVCLEVVRRLGKEYDALLLRQFHARAAELAALPKAQPPTTCCDNNDQPTSAAKPVLIFRASPLEQLIRAVLHATFFGLAYIIMLLAMYYNGYIIISIILGAGLGKYLCDWLVYKVNVADATMAKGVEEPTGCCG